MKHLIVISDWAADSVLAEEFRIVVGGFSREPQHAHVSFIPTTSSAIEQGYLLAQLALTEERYGQPLETVIFVDQFFNRQNDLKAPFVVLRLKTGLYIMGANEEQIFSFVYDTIDEAFVYQGLKKEGSFPARDQFARVAAHLMDAMQDELELEELHMSMISRFDSQAVAYVSPDGTLHTTLTHEDLKGKCEYGDEIPLKIGEESYTVLFAESRDQNPAGKPVIFPGWFGNPKNPYLSLSGFSRDMFMKNLRI